MGTENWAVLVLEDHVRRHTHPCEFCEYSIWKRWKAAGGMHGRRVASPRALEGLRRYYRASLWSDELEHIPSKQEDRRVAPELRGWSDTIPGEGWIDG